MPPHCCSCSKCPQPALAATVARGLSAAAEALVPVLLEIGMQLDLMDSSGGLFARLHPKTEALYLDLEDLHGRLKALRDQPAYSDMQCDRDPPGFCRECDYSG